MINIFNILIGWFRSKVYASKSIQELSNERLQHCTVCPFAVEKDFLKFINGDIQEIKTKCCSKCGCPVVEKSLVKSEKCPEGKWKSQKLNWLSFFSFKKKQTNERA